MSLTNIKSKSQAQRGFTIVELLIVVVVIAILAAITIVSYNGITNRANASSAKSTGANWQKKLELYQAEKGGYPFAFSSLYTSPTSTTGDAWYVASNTPLATVANLSSSNGKTTAAVQPCSSTGSAPTNDATTSGIRITYYNYESTGTPVINIGTTTTCAAAWVNP